MDGELEAWSGVKLDSSNPMAMTIVFVLAKAMHSTVMMGTMDEMGAVTGLSAMLDAYTMSLAAAQLIYTCLLDHCTASLGMLAPVQCRLVSTPFLYCRAFPDMHSRNQLHCICNMPLLVWSTT